MLLLAGAPPALPVAAPCCIEGVISVAEGRVESIEAELNDPNFYVTRAAEASQRMAELAESKAEVARLYARWAELEKRGE